MNKEFRTTLEAYVKEYSPYVNIILIAHVQAPRGHLNEHQIQCETTERFSIEEFHEIYQGIVSAGFYIQSVYFNELDFISDYIEHSNRFKNCLVYNLARNGLGDNKKTIIPAFCELNGIPYTTSSSLTCALCRNKYYFSTLLETHNIPVPQSWLLDEKGNWSKESPQANEMIICKPASESASQGINENSIFPASESKFESLKSGNYIIQSYIEGDECEVPVFKINDVIYVLPPIGIDLKGKQILDEDTSEKYNYGFYLLADTQSNDTITRIKQYAKRTFELLQMDVYGRIDFRIDKDGNPYVFDISTTPYTTLHSSVSFVFDQLGYSYPDIYKAIIIGAIQKNYQKDKNWRSDNKNPRP